MDGRMKRWTLIVGLIFLGSLAWADDAVLQKSGVAEILSLPISTAPFTQASSYRPRMSGNGRYVVFESMAKLVKEDKDKAKDVYLFDRENLTFRRFLLKETLRSNAGPAISGNGRVIVFHSYT